VNRNFAGIPALILVSLVFGFLTDCSSSSSSYAASASHHRDHGDERIRTKSKRR